MAVFRFIATWTALAGLVDLAFVGVSSQLPIAALWIKALMMAAAQWALLRTRVSWAGRWAAGTAASPVLVTVAAPLLVALFRGRTGSSAVSPYVAIVNLLAVAPLVIALAPVLGGRSFAWLVTRPLALALAQVVTLPLLPLLTIPGTRLLGAFVWAAVAAAVDAVVLLWASRGGVLARNPAALIAGNRAIGVEVPVAIIALILVTQTFPALVVEDAMSDGLLYLAVTAPYLITAACMLTPALRRAGLRLASGGGAIVAVVTLLLAVLTTLWLVPQHGESPGLGRFAAFVSMHGGLAFTAFRLLKNRERAT